MRWSPWSPCSKSCGSGDQRRISHAGQTESRGCNTRPCPQPQWSPWSPCSTTCGQGEQTRINDADQTERRDCNTGSCPTPRPVTWSRWSSCSASCGGGTRKRTRSDGRIENQECNSVKCSFDNGTRSKSTRPSFPARLDWSERGTHFVNYFYYDILIFVLVSQGLCLQLLPIIVKFVKPAPPSPSHLQLSPAWRLNQVM